MRGFLIGTLALIALEVGVTGKGPEAAQVGAGWFNSVLQRLLSADVAGVPQRRAPSAGPAGAAGGGKAMAR